jgi:hypothetical protein
MADIDDFLTEQEARATERKRQRKADEDARKAEKEARDAAWLASFVGRFPARASRFVTVADGVATFDLPKCAVFELRPVVGGAVATIGAGSEFPRTWLVNDVDDLSEVIAAAKSAGKVNRSV